MSSDDRLRHLLEELRPPGGFDVDGDLAAVRRRAARRARGRVFLASAASIAMVAGTVAVVAAVRNGGSGGRVAGGGGGTAACVATDELTGAFESFATGALPSGQRYELRSRGEDAVLEVEVWLNGSRVVTFPVQGTDADSLLARYVQNKATGGIPLVIGAAPAGRSARLAFEGAGVVEYPLVDGVGGRHWFVGVTPGPTQARTAEVVGTDGTVRAAPLLTTPPECVGS